MHLEKKESDVTSYRRIPNVLSTRKKITIVFIVLGKEKA